MQLYCSADAIARSEDLFAYQHLLLRAWAELRLSAVLVLDGIPTVYVRDDAHALTPDIAAKIHNTFWNQGVASVLLLRDPTHVRVFSAMTPPLEPIRATPEKLDSLLVEAISLAEAAIWTSSFYLQLATGRYYNAPERADKFDRTQTVDSYLLRNLRALSVTLEEEGPRKLASATAHAFIGRVLFSCYLCHRGIIKLQTYFPHADWADLRQLLADPDTDPHQALYGVLFPALKKEFNSSMFDDDLVGERAEIQPEHFVAVFRFLNGDELKSGQRSLGFWAYNFSIIPVETISSIYESFLIPAQKRKEGAYYTPRFLAEMTLDLALGHQKKQRANQRYVDPACGSGIFLVLLFSRLAAQWHASQRRKAGTAAKAKALLALLGRLRGIDSNLTACRIACFSLYIAYLDQFDPPDIASYKAKTDGKLPSILAAKGAKRPDIAVIWHSDFFDLSKHRDWSASFDTAIGNPPWTGRGKKQIAQRFMEEVPKLLKVNGTATLILPSKMFFNNTDTFQLRWLQAVSVSVIVQLADYRNILFPTAKCPAAIVAFTKAAPGPGHEVEYVTPKVTRGDAREGVVQVSPQDRKFVPLRRIIESAETGEAGLLWKALLWGTVRDLKLLAYLSTLPRLGALTGKAKAYSDGKRPWFRSTGFQPLRPDSKVGKNDVPIPLVWPLSDTFVTPDHFSGLASLPIELAGNLGDHLRQRGYKLDFLHRDRDEQTYVPPLVLWNRGFTDAAYFDYPVRFQHSVHAISAAPVHSKHLQFLTAFLRSSLARYFVFHTAGSLASERDQVHMEEALQLPFFLPSDEVADPACAKILDRIVDILSDLKSESDRSAARLSKRPSKTGLPLFDRAGTREAATDSWFSLYRERTQAAQRKIDALMYEYYGLTAQDIALVEDTCGLFYASHTPTDEGATQIPTLEPVMASELRVYSDMLVSTLNEWTPGLCYSPTGSVHADTGLGFVQLVRTKAPAGFALGQISDDVATAMQRLQKLSTTHHGTLEYLRNGMYFDANRVTIVKPARRGDWTRTAALDDALLLFDHVVVQRDQRTA